MPNAKMRQIIKNLFPETILGFVRELRYLIKSSRSKRGIRSLFKAHKSVCLEIGAGNKKGVNGWVTLDMAPDCDIYWDLLRGIPFPTGSVEKIYSSHVLEHFTLKEIRKLLGECFRVLAPGGTFSVCVPNARLYAEAYVAGKELDRSVYFHYQPAYNNISPIDCLNYTAYMDGLHKYMFDEQNLLRLLEQEGFREVRLRGFDESLDLKARDFESIYAEAKK